MGCAASKSIDASTVPATKAEGLGQPDASIPHGVRDAHSRRNSNELMTSLDDSTQSESCHSNSMPSRRRSVGSGSALGLDKMIDEKRGAKNMSERVVHMEVPFGKPIEEVYNGVHDGPVLGTGISGLVRLVSHKATGRKYAVKVLNLSLVDTEEGLQQLREEIFIMCQLDHPNIIRLEEVYESHSEIYLVQQLCLGGELFDCLDEQPDYHYTEAQCARLVTQMLSSVRYIHSKGIIHRDLKLENFLFTDTGVDSELKMIDFGLSKHFKTGEIQHEAVGTPYTVAPEVIRGIYDERCDVWAIGVVTYLLLSGESPFGGCGGPESLIEMRENIVNCNYVFDPEDIWDSVSVNAKQFIRRILVADVSMRPTARDVQKDVWLTDMADCSKGHNNRALKPSMVKALVNFKDYSYMRKFLCAVLSFTMTSDQILELRQEFEKIDTDGSGEISLSALKMVLLGNGAQGSFGALVEGEVEEIFNAMRASSTESTIQWHEFIAAGLCHCKVDDRNLKLAFDRLDADHTGFITFDNVMDLIGNCAEHSEEALRQMWGEASTNSSKAHITYEDFLILMNGMMKANPTVVEGTSATVEPVIGGGFMSPSSFNPEEKLSEGPFCIDDEGDNEALNQGFAEVMQHEGSGLIIKASLAQEPSPDKLKDKLKSFDMLDDKSKTNYRAHRSMRLAVHEASTRLEEEQERRAREEMRKEQAKLNTSAGLIMRHGGELSPEAIAQFVVQKKKEEQKMVQEATKRTGRRHNRKKTSSDIRGMFGGPGSDAGGLSSSSRCVTRRGSSSKRGNLDSQTIQTLPMRKHAAASGVHSCPPLKQSPLPPGGLSSSKGRAKRGRLGTQTIQTIQTLPTMCEDAAVSGVHNCPPLEQHPLPPAAPPRTVSSDIVDLPIGRNATKPGQFRKTNYDPFSFVLTKEPEGGGHLDLSVRYRSRATRKQKGRLVRTNSKD